MAAEAAAEAEAEARRRLRRPRAWSIRNLVRRRWHSTALVTSLTLLDPSVQTSATNMALRCVTDPRSTFAARFRRTLSPSDLVLIAPSRPAYPPTRMNLTRTRSGTRIQASTSIGPRLSNDLTIYPIARYIMNQPLKPSPHRQLDNSIPRQLHYHPTSFHLTARTGPTPARLQISW